MNSARTAPRLTWCQAAGPTFRRLRATAFWTLAALTLVTLGLGLAELAVRLEPVVPADAASIQPVRIEADERLFTFMAAFNAAGYDDENNADSMHPVRQAVRDALVGKDLPSLTRLRPRL